MLLRLRLLIYILSCCSALPPSTDDAAEINPMYDVSKSVAVKGRIFCEGRPMQNVPAFIVAKTDLKRYIVLNDEATDTFGRFSMEGTFFPNLDAGVTAEFEVGFMHNCKSGSRQDKPMATWTAPIPTEYISFGSGPLKVYHYSIDLRMRDD
ncbi:Protein TTR-8 [Aphelenchoides avenae]|nr:Protein TTR-8 [Aphelenchus avenae]